MKDHYNLTDVEYNKLIKRVTIMDMLKAIPFFKGDNGIGKLQLMHYIDTHGDFRKGIGFVPHREIANAVFNSMQADEQIEILEYFEWEEIDNELTK